MRDKTIIAGNLTPEELSESRLSDSYVTAIGISFSYERRNYRLAIHPNGRSATFTGLKSNLEHFKSIEREVAKAIEGKLVGTIEEQSVSDVKRKISLGKILTQREVADYARKFEGIFDNSRIFYAYYELVSSEDAENHGLPEDKTEVHD